MARNQQLADMVLKQLSQAVKPKEVDLSFQILSDRPAKFVASKGSVTVHGYDFKIMIGREYGDEVYRRDLEKLKGNGDFLIEDSRGRHHWFITRKPVNC